MADRFTITDVRRNLAALNHTCRHQGLDYVFGYDRESTRQGTRYHLYKVDRATLKPGPTEFIILGAGHMVDVLQAICFAFLLRNK